MFSGLEEERTRFRKKEKEKRKKKRERKEKKRKKTSCRPKVGWYKRKGILRHILVRNIFCCTKPFLNKTAFYAKPLGRFSGPKTKVT